MHRHKATDYGLEVKVTQVLEPEVARLWKHQMREAIQHVEGPFSLLLDLTGVDLASRKTPEEIYQIIKDCRRAGLRRLAILVDSEGMWQRSKGYVRSGGLQEITHFFRADEDPGYEEKAIQWIREPK